MEAQCNVGVAYLHAKGTELDKEKAIYWLKKAAEQGDEIAIKNLDLAMFISEKTQG